MLRLSPPEADLRFGIPPGRFWSAAPCAAIVVSALLLWRNLPRAAWPIFLCLWLALGALAASVEPASVPANEVARLLAPDQVDGSVPLRSPGCLREDPRFLPRGRRFEIDLEQVEIAGAQASITGGLRAQIDLGPRTADAPDRMRAGDRLEDRAEKFPLLGDMEKRAANGLFHEPAPVAADFLKGPARASRPSSTEDFLAAVGPEVVVVSVGEDKQFGHPVDAVVQSYKNAGVPLLRTDKEGAVTATTDGKTIRVTTYAEQHLDFAPPAAPRPAEPATRSDTEPAAEPITRL